MKTQTKPSPDLGLAMADVVAQLKKLTPKQIEALAVACEVSSVTVKNIRDEKGGPMGPSFNVMVKLQNELPRMTAAATT